MSLLTFGMGGFGDGDEYKPSYPPPSHYMNVGHEGHGRGITVKGRNAVGAAQHAEMWMHHEGELKFKKPTPKVRTHWDWLQHDHTKQPLAFGRVDHQKKQISIQGNRMHPAYDKAMGKLQERHPDYDIHEFASRGDPSDPIDVGHHGGDVELWWHEPGVGIKTKKTRSFDENHSAQGMVSSAVAQGRIDHEGKMISYVHNRRHGVETIHSALKQELKSRHPGYTVHEFASPVMMAPSAYFDAYSSVGHDDSHDNDLWWMNHRGLQTLKSRGLHHVDVIGPGDWLARGRIDHDKKQISIKQARLMPSELTQRTAAQAEQELKEQWPKYDVKHFAAPSSYVK